MGRALIFSCLLAALGVPAAAFAQPTKQPTKRPAAQPQQPAAAQPAPAQPEEDEPSAEEELEEEVEGEEGEGDEGDTQLRPPDVEPLQVEPEVEGEGEGEGEDVPDPGEMQDRLDRQAPAGEGSGTASTGWTAPQVTFDLHGYFRVRGELQDTFYLGRTPVAGLTTDPPFGRFRPIDGRLVPEGGCGDEAETGMGADDCDTETLGFANMRLRLMPTVNVSDTLKVHAWIDVFDNMVLGSTPDGYFTEPDAGFTRPARSPFVPLEAFSTTSVPPTHLRNSLGDSIVARRAWAEVTNRDLGQLRFGRMGSDWGLGILANGGEGLDDDYSSDVDRIMALTRIAGFYIVGAYDFPSEGLIASRNSDLTGLAWDAGQDDDVDQYVLAVARRASPEEQRDRLQLGEVVLNGGIYFVYRDQLISSEGTSAPLTRDVEDDEVTLVRRGAEAFIPDLWVQVLWRSLRIELEAVMIAGSIENIEPDSFAESNMGIFQLGAALEVEYALLNDKLHLYLYSGFASGDSEVEGLTSEGGLQPQIGDDTISTFRFHPNYRVDLILWRSIMRQISGAYYFRPGIAYDFDRNAFGRLLQARLDVIWSRASSPVQTPGNEHDLGVEVNATLSYRSEDGPDLLDGFYAQVQYGILFPMAGLGYLDGQMPGFEFSNAQTLRAVLGVQW